MKTNKLTLGLLTATMAFTGLASTAYGAERGERPQLSDEVRTELRSLVQAGDYDAYVSFATDNDLRVMDEERFDSKAEKIATKEQAQEAALDGDYNEWRAIVGDDKLTDIDANNFYLITDLAEARESDDEEAKAAAKQALQDAGIERPGKGKGSRGERNGERGGFSDRFGVERDDVQNLSDDEKEDLLQNIIEQIRERLGLS